MIPQKRTSDEQILSACQLTNVSEREKRRVILAIDSLELLPFTVTDQRGISRAALTHNTLLANLPTNGPVTLRVDPTAFFRNPEKQLCIGCSPSPSPGLENLIATSPYAAILLRMNFVELSKSTCDLLNEDWVSRPELKFACSKLLAGCILLNTANSHAIMVNCVELYGRKKQIDIHREPFRLIKGKAPQTSIPPFGETRYDDVWPMTIASKDGDRLTIGTHAFNALVTSSIRLDLKEPPSIGGTTVSFSLKDTQSSKATVIFLDCESIKAADKLISDKSVQQNSRGNEVEQLRQLRSKFDEPSTYFRCRAPSRITKDHTAQPFTIFTLVSSDSLEKGSGRAAAVLFNRIAICSLTKEREMELHLRIVKESIELCETSTKIRGILEDIEKLFKGQGSIPVLGNKSLNLQLTKLAQELASYITIANKTVAAFIEDRFSPA
ncbi:hypothetical protein BGX21_005041 [Mortierella sp. AD011]|nr:hypothetical protein BGX20_005173 [Mortierella sp. AD010]KAF9371669.1 hypothetical protein BGX21_005041 [Mortierella sp. AD011]